MNERFTKLIQMGQALVDNHVIEKHILSTLTLSDYEWVEKHFNLLSFGIFSIAKYQGKQFIGIQNTIH